MTLYQYDKRGRVIREINPVSDEKAYTYDANGNITRVIAIPRNPLVMVRDFQEPSRQVMGRVIREINPVLDEKAYTYDANGNITAIVDEDGNETRIRYDLNIQLPSGSVILVKFPHASYWYPVTFPHASVTEAMPGRY